jgi:hypothetical protein
MRRRKRRGLGSSPKQHAAEARQAIDKAITYARGSQTGSCTLRFDSLQTAAQAVGEIRAQAFRSGGKVAKGAVTPKTVSTQVAKRAYDAMDAVDRAADAFARDCVKKNWEG